MPKHWTNSLALYTRGEDLSKPDEYLIRPYSSFTLTNISEGTEFINDLRLNEETKELLENAKIYEMTLTNIPFHEERKLLEWFELPFDQNGKNI